MPTLTTTSTTTSAPAVKYTDLLSTMGAVNPAFAKFTAMDTDAQLGTQAMLDAEAAQYQKSGGCMYKRGKRVRK